MAGVLLHEVLRVPSIVFVAHHALAFLDLVYRCVHGVTIFSFIGIGRIPELPDEQRTIAVLLPVQVAHEVEYVLRVVLIDRRVRQAADDRHGIRAVADQDHRNPEYHRVRDHPTRALGPTQAEHDQRAQGDEIEQVAGVERESEVIDEHQFELAREFRNTRDDHSLYGAQYHRTDQEGRDHAARSGLITLEVVDHGDGRDAQQGQ